MLGQEAGRAGYRVSPQGALPVTAALVCLGVSGGQPEHTGTRTFLPSQRGSAARVPVVLPQASLSLHAPGRCASVLHQCGPRVNPRVISGLP